MRNVPLIQTIAGSQLLLSDYLYRCEQYEIKRWAFGQMTDEIGGFNDCFCFLIVTNGLYSFSIARQEYTLHTGHVIVEKPDFDYHLRPTIGKCTVFNIGDSLYKQLLNEPAFCENGFLSRKQRLSQVMLSSPTIDYLHYKLLGAEPLGGKLAVDDIFYELLHEVLELFNGTDGFDANTRFYRKDQLSVMERAREYIHGHFRDDIGLQEIAENSFVSPFHFSRLFKKLMLQTPHQYLLNIRLKHAELLLRSSETPISDVAFFSGFSTADYFSTAFKKRYGIMPRDYRRGKKAL